MRFGDKVWYCKRLDTPMQDGNEYGEPIEITTRPMHFTVMDKNGYLDILEFGSEVSKYATAIAQPYGLWKNAFKEGDLFYINGATPNSTEDYNGEKANYIVDSIIFQNLAIKLTLKKR